MEQKKEELKNKTEQSEKITELMKTKLEHNNKCQKLQQLEANKMEATIEEVKQFSKNDIKLLTY